MWLQPVSESGEGGGARSGYFAHNLHPWDNMISNMYCMKLLHPGAKKICEYVNMPRIIDTKNVQSENSFFFGMR